MAVDLGRLLRQIRRRVSHPTVRAERYKMLGALCHNGALALIVGAGVAPFLNPDLQPPVLVRIIFVVIGLALLVAGQVLLGYMVDDETDDD